MKRNKIRLTTYSKRVVNMEMEIVKEVQIRDGYKLGSNTFVGCAGTNFKYLITGLLTSGYEYKVT